MYWNMTGHPPPQAEVAVNLPPSPSDWPNLGSMVAKFRRAPQGLPGAVQLPYPLVDNNTLQAGDGPGFLGQANAPVILRPNRGVAYKGVSRDLGAPVLQPCRRRGRRPPATARLAGPGRRARPAGHGASGAASSIIATWRWTCCSIPVCRRRLISTAKTRACATAYGDHICGQSVLLARRLVEVGVPIVTVIAAAGDLNGSAGDNWDTHGNNFHRLKNDLLPPLERASARPAGRPCRPRSARQTLVVWLTEFGRTPKLNGGRPRSLSALLFGRIRWGGVRGGQVYGRSDRIAAEPADLPCGPNDLHATIFHALGIPLESQLTDNLGRPFPITDGVPLPL